VLLLFHVVMRDARCNVCLLFDVLWCNDEMEDGKSTRDGGLVEWSGERKSMV